jgi:hypothetical protein
LNYKLSRAELAEIGEVVVADLMATIDDEAKA